MVICCVPNCGADSWKCDGSITFYDFPANPDLAAKWIKQINTAVKARPMWFPRGKAVICSKHFLHTDFKDETDSLKPRSIPTVFGHKYIGPNPESNTTNKLSESKTSPFIIKVIKPQNIINGNDSSFRILDVRSGANVNNFRKSNYESSAEIMDISEVNSEVSSLEVDDNLEVVYESGRQNSSNSLNNVKLSSKVTNEKSNSPNVSQYKNNTVGTSGIKLNCISKGISKNKPNPVLKKIFKKNEKCNSDLIEIGPNTFLKINPDIIKVNKKQTPSGNTVIQFLMDQKLAKSCSGDLLPQLIQNVPPVQGNSSTEVVNAVESSDNTNDKDSLPNSQRNSAVQHILGHIVDTQACEEIYADPDIELDDDIHFQDSQDKTNNASNEQEKNNSPGKADASFIEKAPVLLTTNMPLSQCFADKSKYVMQLKQKNRQIASLKVKISSLNKKIEELEDRCIVQERQLSYSFIKSLKSIRKDALKGDPRATYILEQIRSYSNNSKMRWSDTTLTQCAIWCRKAPYAYEYFKKAEFFKLPCLGSVKRYMKKHPEIKFLRSVSKTSSQGAAADDDDESSDFDFDESDGQNGTNDFSENEDNGQVRCETILSVPSETEDSNVKDKNSKESDELSKATESISDASAVSVQKNVTDDTNAEKAPGTSNNIESNGIPITVDSSNLELQEIILPSGEVVQCYSSTIGDGTDVGGQYYIIPNVGEQNLSGDHEYSVIPADSLPAVLQNLEKSQLHLQQDQLIFIANSSDQVGCSETEVTTA